MSQHRLVTSAIGADKVEVLIGWDRPLSGFFAVVSTPGCGDDEGSTLYSNLDERLTRDVHPKDFDFFLPRLAGLGIVLPEDIVEAVKQDGVENAGNKCVDHGERPVFNAPVPTDTLASAGATGKPVTVRVGVPLSDLWHCRGDVERLNDLMDELVCGDLGLEYSLTDIGYRTVTFSPDLSPSAGWFGGTVWLLGGRLRRCDGMRRRGPACPCVRARI